MPELKLRFWIYLISKWIFFLIHDECTIFPFTWGIPTIGNSPIPTIRLTTMRSDHTSFLLWHGWCATKELIKWESVLKCHTLKFYFTKLEAWKLLTMVSTELIKTNKKTFLGFIPVEIRFLTECLFREQLSTWHFEIRFVIVLAI